MREVTKSLWVGNQSEYETGMFDDSFSFVLAAKNPFHKDTVGYTGKSCDKDHPEYLWAYRENKMVLNMVDAPSSLYFNKRMIDEALAYIHNKRCDNRRIAIICNKGESRSAGIALLYMIRRDIVKGETLEDCEAEFMKVYPEYNPGTGMRGFLKEHFEVYSNG
jgi:hypothetical protein